MQEFHEPCRHQNPGKPWLGRVEILTVERAYEQYILHRSDDTDFTESYNIVVCVKTSMRD